MLNWIKTTFHYYRQKVKNYIKRVWRDSSNSLKHTSARFREITKYDSWKLNARNAVIDYAFNAVVILFLLTTLTSESRFANAVGIAVAIPFVMSVIRGFLVMFKEVYR